MQTRRDFSEDHRHDCHGWCARSLRNASADTRARHGNERCRAGARPLRAGLASFVADLPLAPPLIVAAIFGIYFVMGALMEEIAILVIMTPIVYPVVTGLGYDGVWFGVMSIMMLLTGLLTPPVGLLSFVTSSATGVALEKVYRGVTPFWLTLIVPNALVIAFPDIALFLPNLMRT